MATVMNSSPRRAFFFKASSERCRSTDSSISLMVPCRAAGGCWDDADRRRRPRRQSAYLRDRRTSAMCASHGRCEPSATPRSRQPRRHARRRWRPATSQSRAAQAAAGAAKIVVDDGDIAPAELLRPVCKLRDDRRRRAAELAEKATAVKKKPGPGPGSVVSAIQ
jgi:hypothetical protein